jgi:hypothetical protein
MSTSTVHEVPLLLTSSVIAYDTSVRLTDTAARTRLAMESIAQWLRIDPQLPLVLCDGSNFDFTDAIHREFPQARIECIPFENDQEAIRRLGRGYGEGEIIHHALSHSKLITEAGCFAKCTSKLWVENFQQCTAEWNGNFLCKGVFLDAFSPFRKTIFSYIDTRFYIASVAFYLQNFKEAHKRVGMRNGKFFSLEDCFHEIVLQQNISGILLNVSPIICGVGGGTGVHYKSTWLRRRKENLRLHLARMTPTFRRLFTTR